MNAKIQVELQDFMGDDRAIAMSAWTSTYNKDRIEDKCTDESRIAELVPRLIREGHSTPVESVILRFWIRHPIFTDRQHMTHRIQSSSGLSARYRTMPGDWYSIPQDVIAIAEKLRPGQSSDLNAGFDGVLDACHTFYKEVIKSFKEGEQVGKITNAEYKRAREIIRGVLGTAFMVERTSILNLRSFANYQRLRNSSHAQAEIKSVAVQMLEQVKAKGVAPIAIATLEEMGWVI